MSIEITLNCDGLPHGVPCPRRISRRTLNEVRKVAAEEGWTHDLDSDRCPQCSVPAMAGDLPVLPIIWS